MKEFYIDFSGYVVVEAENADEAERKFWSAIHRHCPFDSCQDFRDDVWDVDATEEVTDDISNVWNKQSVVDFLIGKEE
jgi:hypothetical protein